eukprot:3074395-Amphidinium_carterae.1
MALWLVSTSVHIHHRPIKHHSRDCDAIVAKLIHVAKDRLAVILHADCTKRDPHHCARLGIGRHAFVQR